MIESDNDKSENNLTLRNKKIIKRDTNSKANEIYEPAGTNLIQQISSPSLQNVSITKLEETLVNADVVIENLNSNIINDNTVVVNGENFNDLVGEISNQSIIKNFINSNSNLNMSLIINQFIKIVPEFDGNSCNLHKFLKCCDLIYKPLVAKDDKDTFLELVATKLNGSAYEIIKYNNFESWDELKSILKKQFEVNKSVEHLQIELVQANQKQNESILEFANRIQQILSLLNDACIAREGTGSKTVVKNLNSGTALRSFIDGLRNEKIQNIVKSCRFTLLKEAIDKAIEEEISFSKNKFIKSNQTPQCQWCNKRGHVASKCFSLQNRTNNSNDKNVSPSSTVINNSIKVNKFCNYCKRRGHLIDTCFLRKNKEKPDSQPSENSKPLGQKNTSTQVGNL